MANKKNTFFSDFLTGFIISVILLVAYFLQLGVFEVLENKIYDFRALLRQSKKPGDAVVIVAIDDSSISSIGRWPWPRSVMADIISKISEGQPKIIGLSILYSEPEESPGLDMFRELKQKYFAMLTDPTTKRSGAAKVYQTVLQDLSAAEQGLDSDAILENTFLACQNVILPMYFSVQVPDVRDKDEQPLLSSSTLLGLNSFAGNENIPEGYYPSLPLEPFALAAVGLGHVNSFNDIDGVLRRESLVIKHINKLYPSFALQLASVFLDTNISDIKLNKSNELVVGKSDIPIDKKFDMMINFVGPAQSFKYFSVVEILKGNVPVEAFKDRIVLIGSMATGIASLNTVPVGSNYPSIEVTANVLQNIIAKRFILRPKWAVTVEIVTLVLCALFVMLLLPRLKAQWGAILASVLMIIIIGTGTYLFAANGYWIKIMYSTMLLMLGYIVIVSKRFLFTEKRKELVEAESIETNKMLGLSFQGQGMLDLAFDKFSKCPLDDQMKDLLYNLALDFERKRQLNKAIAVYEHIANVDPNFKDVKARIDGAKNMAPVMSLGGAAKADGTVMISGAGQKPTLGRYEIEKELGRGAMGIVYLGKDPKINRMVAIKTLKFDDDVSEEQMKAVKERFFREAESAGKLSHPNIIRVFDAGDDMDVSYIAMELLDGSDFKQYCEKDKLLPIPEVIDIIIKVADALDYAHAEGVIHRDIKPANIMTLKAGGIRVTDFGIARITASSKTQTGTVLGTPSYMSPEQISGKKVDGRSDLFSLGVMFYEMLVGKKPFEGDSIGTLLYQIVNEKHPSSRAANPNIPEYVEKVIDKMLEKNADNRYSRGKEIVADLKQCLALMNTSK
ncbi:MAG: serine/threonine-protein kinase [Elusimicrobiota bacterium]